MNGHGVLLYAERGSPNLGRLWTIILHVADLLESRLNPI